MIVRKFRLRCSLYWVDVRVAEHEGRWIASADTSGGPSLGIGHSQHSALLHALDPFETVAAELLKTAPHVAF